MLAVSGKLGSKPEQIPHLNPNHPRAQRPYRQHRRQKSLGCLTAGQVGRLSKEATQQPSRWQQIPHFIDAQMKGFTATQLNHDLRPAQKKLFNARK